MWPGTLLCVPLTLGILHLSQGQTLGILHLSQGQSHPSHNKTLPDPGVSELWPARADHTQPSAMMP